MIKTLPTLIFLFIGFLPFTLFGQWEYFQDTPESQNFGNDIVELNNGNFAACGTQRNLANDTFEGLLTVVNPDGQEVFSRTFGEILMANGDVILPVNDGMIVIGRSLNVGNDDQYLIAVKINFNNEIVWSSSNGDLGYVNPVSNGNIDAVLRPNGDILVASSVQSLTGSYIRTQLTTIKANGDYYTNLELSGSGGTDEFCRSIDLTADGDLIITGQSAGGLYIKKARLFGLESWKNLYFDDLLVSQGNSVIIDANDDIIVSGWMNDSSFDYPKSFVIKLNNDGDLIWEKIIEAGQGLSINDICLSADGGYALLGTVEFEDIYNSHFITIKLNDQGLQEWRNIFDHLSDSWGQSIIAVEDEKYVVAGFDSGSDNITDLYIAKTFESGYISQLDNKPEFTSTLSLSPIPTTSKLNVQFELEAGIALTIEIFNSLGQSQIKLGQNHFFPGGTHHLNTDVSHLKSGFYQIRIASKTGAITKTFIKI